MKSNIGVVLTLSAALVSAPAAAADMYNVPLRGTYTPVVAAPQSSGWTGWEGPYAGVYGALPTNSRLTVSPGASLQPYISGDYRTSVSGGGGGAITGFNFQSGSLVYGAEADLGFVRLSAKEGASIGSLTAGARIATSYMGTARARIGFASGRLLAYATGGLSVTTLKGEAFAYVSGTNVFAYRNSQTVAGLALGAGLEYALTDRLNARGEYIYSAFEKATYSDAVNAKLNVGLARMAIVSKF